MRECDHCHEVKVNVEYLADPFTYEIYDEIYNSYWCDDCYSNRKDEI